jgi:hypothetical protein
MKATAEHLKLLHGSLANLDHSSDKTSANLERFWTRFAFQFESVYLNPQDPGQLLPTWLGGYPSPSPGQTIKAKQAIEDLHEQLDDGAVTGLMSRDGPIYTSASVDDSLIRYLVNTLPPPPSVENAPLPTSTDRSSLGLGFGLGLRRKPKPASGGVAPIQNDERQSSWTSWVPGIGIGSGSATVKEEAGGEEEKSTTTRWPSFGLSSLGMGTMFGTGTGSEQKQQVGDRATLPETASIASSHQVEQSEVVLNDLEAAVEADVEVELLWDKKDIWLDSGNDGKEFTKRRLMWIIVCPIISS